MVVVMYVVALVDVVCGCLFVMDDVIARCGIACSCCVGFRHCLDWVACVTGCG